MKPFTRLDALTVPLRDADIDTDQILPARFMHKPREDYGQYCFRDLRVDIATGAIRNDFILNDAAYKGASAIVAGPNFGCGSSREQAVHTLNDYGFRALLGTSFGDIFASNCVKNGLLPVRLTPAFVLHLFAQVDRPGEANVVIDLEQQVVIASDGASEAFVIDAFQRESLLNGVDEIDLTLGLAHLIDGYEASYRSRRGRSSGTSNN